MVAPPRHTMTEQEYLVSERAHEWKHEFFRGDVTAMPLVTFLHAQIVGNTAVTLHQTLRGHCSVLVSAMRMKVEAADFYAYPDIIVVCGPAELADEHRDIVLNPTVLIEVLSPSTEAYDRGKKFGHYRKLESLKEYLLIAQDAPLVEPFVRQDDGTWLFAASSGMLKKPPNNWLSPDPHQAAQRAQAVHPTPWHNSLCLSAPWHGSCCQVAATLRRAGCCGC